MIFQLLLLLLLLTRHDPKTITFPLRLAVLNDPFKRFRAQSRPRTARSFPSRRARHNVIMFSTTFPNVIHTRALYSVRTLNALAEVQWTTRRDFVHTLSFEKLRSPKFCTSGEPLLIPAIFVTAIWIARVRILISHRFIDRNQKQYYSFALIRR